MILLRLLHLLLHQMPKDTLDQIALNILEELQDGEWHSSAELRHKFCPRNYPTKFMRQLKKAGYKLRRGMWFDKFGHKKYQYKIGGENDTPMPAVQQIMPLIIQE